MKDCNCGYCVGGEPLAKFGIKICDLQVSQLILFKEQSHPGRVIVAYKDHISELIHISDEERNLFFGDVAAAANAIHKVFHPDKVNYGATAMVAATCTSTWFPSMRASLSGAAPLP